MADTSFTHWAFRPHWSWQKVDTDKCRHGVYSGRSPVASQCSRTPKAEHDGLPVCNQHKARLTR